jgi:tetrahydromethanopterin S-methyltransferase subunit B
MICSIGEFGGLLFLGFLVGTAVTATVALILGAIAVRWFRDVNRLEAMQGTMHREPADK